MRTRSCISRAAALLVSLIAGGILLQSCGSLRIDQPMRVREGDWPMFAGSPTRTGLAASPIIPPLVQEWELGVSGGIGNGSPLMVDNVLIVGNLRGELYAAVGSTGEQIGSTKLGDAIQGSPAVGGDIAYVAVSNSSESLLGFDLRSGKTLWKKDYGDLEVSPLLLNGRLYFGNTSGSFFCANPTNGELIWRYDIPDNKLHDGFRSSAAGEARTVVVGGENGLVYGFDAEKGTVRWSYRTGVAIMGTPSIAGGLAFVGDLQGAMYAIEVESGRLRWRYESGAPIHGNAAAASGVIFFGNLGGTLTALQADSGSPLWVSHLESPVNSGPAIAGDYLYIGTLKKFLFAVRTADGTIAWKEELSGRIKTSPAAVNGRLLVATDDWVVISFKEASKK
jgi:outer membrane protein assembly factor BamB